MLSLLYRHNNSRNGADFNNITSGSSEIGLPSYSQDILDKHNENSVQIDYVHPLKKVSIETGAIFTHRNLHSDFKSISSYRGNENNKIIPEDNETMNYNIGILGIYNSYLLRFPPSPSEQASGMRKRSSMEHTGARTVLSIKIISISSPVSVFATKPRTNLYSTWDLTKEYAGQASIY